MFVGNFASLEITNSTLGGNSTGPGLPGGTFGFAIRDGIPISTGDFGQAGYGGDGGAIFSTGNTAITGSAVTNNTARDDGAGIFASGTTTITSSTISGNSADGRGGAMYASVNAGSIFTTNHTTITNNSTGDRGGGIFATHSSSQTAGIAAVLNHTIVAGNQDSAGEPDLSGGVASPDQFAFKYSLIGINSAPVSSQVGSQIGTLTNPIDAQLAPLADNGGSTQTHAPLTGSPAIDAGDTSILFDANEFDQRGPGAPGFVRVFDGDAIGGARIDIGAYERQTIDPSFFIVTTATDELDFSNTDVSLREAINSANNSDGADTITFDATVFATPQTVLLSLGEIEITDALTIDATALAANVTIDAQQNSRIFNITATIGDFTLAGLTLTGGRTTGNNANFSDNTFSGGAVRSLTTGNLTLDQSTVSGNSTTGGRGSGGGIFSDGNVTLNNSTVSGNSMTSGGSGGGIFSDGNVTLNNSTVSGNSTVGFGRGGGIFSDGNVTLNNSTVSGNSTTSGGLGGGIFSSGNVTLNNSTVSGNSVTGDDPFEGAGSGGGIWNDNDTITITNSIVAGNTASGGNDDIRPGLGVLNVNFSLIGNKDGTGLVEAQSADTDGNLIGSAAGSGIIDPLLGPLADNGGPTETHALLPGSPAIDAGDPNFDDVATPTDQRGAPFVREAGLRVDIGAYELQTVAGLNLTVDTNIDENDGDYSAGDLSLREAVGLANGSLGVDTITFAAALGGGTIALQSTLGELAITHTVTIDASSLAAGITIDAGDGTDNLFNTGDGFRIFNINDGNNTVESDVELIGLTLTGGDVSGSGLLGGGGAIFSRENLTITSSMISGNSAGNDGGGIHARSGTMTITSSTISGNSADSDGGGIYARSGTTTITSSTISGNSADRSGGGIRSYGTTTITSSTITENSSNSTGGGIRSSGTTTITSSTISGNSAGGSGGGILSSATTTITSSTISGNSANSAGGGIFSSGTTTITSSTISGNSANSAGGGILSYGTTTITSSTINGNSANSAGGGIRSYGTTTITSSTISGNSAGGDGGGIYAYAYAYADDSTTITSSTISGNSAGDDGGGIRSYGKTTITSSTISGNSADGSGGGIFALSFSDDSTMTIISSTITENQADTDSSGGGSGGGIGGSNGSTGLTTVSLSHTLVAGNDLGNNSANDIFFSDPDTLSANFSLLGTTVVLNTGGIGNIPSDSPLLGPLADNGGPTLTHALLAGSPAVDAGDLSLVGSGFIPFREAFDTAGADVTINVSSSGGLGDTSVTFVDYSDFTVGSTNFNIAEAPSQVAGIAATRGLLLQANVDSGVTSAINVLAGATPIAYSGIYRVSFDAYLNFTETPGATGTTEQLLWGVGTNNDANLEAESDQGGAQGTWGWLTGDNGNSGNDATFLENSSIQSTLNGGNPPYGDAFVDEPAFEWVTVVVEVINGIVSVSYDGDASVSPVGFFSEASLATSGFAMFGYEDPFFSLASAPDDMWGLFDNFRVEEALSFDQRGAPFVRVFGGRIDIGAFEAQPDPIVASADFDNDNDIDGADFLAWQRGLGTSNASPSDGDANGDQVVDAADLTVWEDQYGGPAPLAAVSVPSAVSDQPSAFLAPQNDLAPQYESSAAQTSSLDSRAALIDAVMAFELGRGSQVTESLPLGRETLFAETYADRVFAAKPIGPVSAVRDAVRDNDEIRDTNSGQVEEAEAPWLDGELLERVFS